MTEARRRADAPEPPDDPDRAGVLDLLGLLAYAELVAFFRLSEDAALAPSLADKAALGEMAVAEFGHFRLLWEHITTLGAQPDQVMLPFTTALDAFHARTAPSDWLEGLVKAYVGDGLAADFYRAVAELVDPQTRELVLRVLGDTGHTEFVIARVRAAVAADPQVAGRLALWARRLVGEGLAQAYRVVADRRPLAALLSAGSAAAAAGPAARPATDSPATDSAAADSPASPATGSPGPDSDLGDIGRMLARITDAHAQRMTALGLAS